LIWRWVTRRGQCGGLARRARGLVSDQLPIITANWNATSGNRWNFPIGGGIGKILKIDDQPINAGLQAFDYVQ
jgi:hypothetical protein